MTTANAEAPAPRPSALVAAEVRAIMGRKGINQAELARRLYVGQPWVSRRISPSSAVDLTVEDVLAMAKALDVSVQGLLVPLLPRLDSNQQPSGYRSPQVRAVPSAPVVPIGAARGGTRVNGHRRSGAATAVPTAVPTTRPRALRLA